MKYKDPRSITACSAGLGEGLTSTDEKGQISRSDDLVSTGVWRAAGGEPPSSDTASSWVAWCTPSNNEQDFRAQLLCFPGCSAANRLWQSLCQPAPQQLVKPNTPADSSRSIIPAVVCPPQREHGIFTQQKTHWRPSVRHPSRLQTEPLLFSAQLTPFYVEMWNFLVFP